MDCKKYISARSNLLKSAKEQQSLDQTSRKMKVVLNLLQKRSIRLSQNDVLLSAKRPHVSFLQSMWRFFWLFCAWNYFFKLRFFLFTVISLTLFLLNKLWINLFQENKNAWHNYVKKLCVQSTAFIEAFAYWNYDLKTDFAKCRMADTGVKKSKDLFITSCAWTIFLKHLKQRKTTLR